MTFSGFMLDSMKTASLSEIPGITSTLLISLWLLVKKRPRVLDVVSVIRVGSLTT